MLSGSLEKLWNDKVLQLSFFLMFLFIALYFLGQQLIIVVITMRYDLLWTRPTMNVKISMQFFNNNQFAQKPV